MERKIGEIFEIGGEWYQCVGGTCRNCSFYYDTVCKNIITIGSTNFGNCHCSLRTDHKSVIFKKLEKVREPIIYMSRIFQRLKSPDAKQCKYCYFGNQVCNPQLCGKESFLVEIKQNKEDMEEKKLTYKELLHYYHSTVGLWVIDRSPQEVSLDWICDNAFQLGIDEKDSSLENIGKNLREFDLEEAKAGKPVCTRDGRKARIICFDKGGEQPIVALIEKNGEESIDTFFSNGHSVSKTDEVSGDLMMSPEKKDGWVNLYKSSAYSTKEEAMKYRNKCNDYIDTINITWEE